ncbi:MAG: hypothetical protein QM579_09375 [Desulfovibrio sp.]|uniref:hypothetical protein n=1 Tax=Desulfovibrio sp. TaxID=885 RepID=UPI0039E6287C
MQGYLEIITDYDLAQAEDLLAKAGLSLPAGRTYGLGFYEDGRLAACGFLAGNVICGICVAQHAREGGLATSILSRIVLHGRQEGVSHFFIFTKASEALKFKDSGFDLLAKTEDAGLLEQGRPSYADWLNATRAAINGHGWKTADTDASSTTATSSNEGFGAIVMNANPFTRGHEYLARTAASACEKLLVFVVEEDVSVFPFAVRFNLVRKGLADVGNVLVLPAGPYMVSRASFPAYFTADAKVGSIHATLDCTIFATRIARDLGISLRFVGTEPFDPVTAAYNAAMASVFEKHGIALQEIPRLEASAQSISASKVRAYFKTDVSEESWQTLAKMLPPVTWDFLRSEESATIRQKLRDHVGRH